MKSTTFIRLLKKPMSRKILTTTALEIYLQFSISLRDSKIIKYFLLVQIIFSLKNGFISSQLGDIHLEAKLFNIRMYLHYHENFLLWRFLNTV